jgi:hypothetical protein
MLNFLSGMITMGFVVAAVFFFRFWKRTGDFLFAIFAVSFIFFAVNQGASLFSGLPRDEQFWIYLIRLAGFALLLVGILVKNFGQSASR